MRISIFNSYLKGGASKSAQRLYNGLLETGEDVDFLIKNEKGKEQSIIDGYKVLDRRRFSKKKTDQFLFYLSRGKIPRNILTHRKKIGLDKLSTPLNDFKIMKINESSNSDIINLHWVADFFDLKSYLSKESKPIIWTLHDEFPYSFGEHYNEKFVIDKFVKVIPRIKVEEEIIFERKIREIKLKIFEKLDNLTIVGPSKWISQQSQNSELFSKYKTHVIPYGLDTNVFSIFDKLFAKRFFNVPDDRISILFVADNINENRKGFRILLKALEYLKVEKLNLLIVGSGYFEVKEFLGVHNVINFGRVNDERIMALIYNAADLFVIPSIMDNLPNTALESVCCGTPIIGFHVGGIPDIVINGENGYLCDELDSERLAEQILKGIRNINSFDNKKISEVARIKYSLKAQAKSYTELFQTKLV